MSDWKMQLYHWMPPQIRNLIASTRGYYLQSWRYSSETEKLVEEALERDNWSLAKWKEYQENWLSYVLHRAATQVPYYRQLWSKRRQSGDKSSWEYLENWPILSKEAIRQSPKAFIADDCNIKDMFHEHTSGTTGKSLDLWWSRETVQKWYALFEARWRKWHGVDRHDRWAIMGGQLITPVSQKKPPFWVWNRGMNQLYLSSYHLSPKFLSSYIDALYQYNVKYIYSYTSSIHTLAQEVLRGRYRDLPDIKVILTNAEPVYHHQREAISTAFNTSVRETYGMAETVLAGGECAKGHLHYWPEVGYIEFAEQDVLLKNGNSGELICTGLFNTDMPLIRYQVGDRATLSDDGELCSCGRSLPRLGQIEGRQDDILYTPNGRLIGRLDPVFKSSLSLREAQIIQEKLDFIRVLIIPDNDYCSEDGMSIIKRLKERLGYSVEISLEVVSSIPRTSNGKFRAVICKLSDAEKRELR